MAKNSDQAKSDKGELRRQHLLNAAADCFRKEGFHGTSIARVSRAAGMSPGHIYHYFPNKEAIVEAIARREESEMAELVRRTELDGAGGDLASRLARQVPDAVHRHQDPEHVALLLELFAEGARNPAVQRILQQADAGVIRDFLATAGRVGMPAGMDEKELRLRVTLISSLIYGLMFRGVLDPQPSTEDLIPLVARVVHLLLDKME